MLDMAWGVRLAGMGIIVGLALRYPTSGVVQLQNELWAGWEQHSGFSTGARQQALEIMQVIPTGKKIKIKTLTFDISEPF